MDPIVVIGQKMSGRSFLLSEIGRRQVLDNKHVLMVVSDVQNALIVQKKLTRFLPSEQALVLDPVELLPGQLHKFLTRIKSLDVAFDKNDYLQKSIHKSHLINSMKRYYNGLNMPLLLDKVWHEWIVLNAFDRHSVETLHFNPLFKVSEMSFNQEEFDRLLGLVIKARQFYEQSEAFVDVFFAETIFEHETGMQAWTEIMEWVLEMRKSCVNKLISVGLLINEKISTRIQYSLTHFSHASGLLDHFKLQVKLYSDDKSGQNPKMPEKGLFQKKQPLSPDEFTELPQILINEYDKLLSIFQSIPGFGLFAAGKDLQLGSNMELELLDQKISVFSAFLDVFPVYIRETVRKETGKLNLQATDDPALVKMNEELETFYVRIQEKKILKKSIEPAAFNLDKHLFQLNAMLKQLTEITEKRDQFIKCFSFNKFYFSLTVADRLIIQNILDLAPKDWILFFKNWFIQNAIEQNGYFFYKVADKELKEFAELDLTLNQLSQLSQIKSSEPEIHRSLENIESRHKKLYQQIFNKHQLSNEDWTELMQHHSKLIRLLFPVWIVPVEALQKLKGNIADGFDSVLVDLADAGYETSWSEMLDLAKMNAKKIFVADQSDAYLTKLAGLSRSEVPVFELKGYHQQGLMQLADMNHTERLYGARNLAHLIMDVAPDIEIFKLGNQTLYSCLSAPLNQLLLAMLDQKGIKKMRVLETPFNLLLENILEINTKQWLLTQDGLLDSADVDRIPWQIYVMEQAEKAGIRHVNLDTLDLREAPVKVFRDFIETSFLVNG